jgi:hypothetical protein
MSSLTLISARLAVSPNYSLSLHCFTYNDPSRRRLAFRMIHSKSYLTQVTPNGLIVIGFNGHHGFHLDQLLSTLQRFRGKK